MVQLVSDRFKETRKYLRFNQKEFANELGISQTHISSIENGKENPSNILLKLICVKFNISERWLIDGEGWGISHPNFRTDTDDGLISKYNTMRVHFEDNIRNLSGEDLHNTIEAFSHFTSLILGAKLTGKDKSNYIEHIYNVIDELEKASFHMHVKKNLIPKSQKYQYLYNALLRIDEAVTKVNNDIRGAFAVYTKEYQEYSRHNLKLENEDCKAEDE